MINLYWYYIVDCDGITLVNFGEADSTFTPCNLEGETIHFPVASEGV